jgi:predicted Zn-ribbon and HTH transcriptional regulator
MSIFNKTSLCPNCASHAIHRSRRKGLLERVLHSVLFVSPYRCNACDERYFRLRLPVHSVEKPPHHAA